MRKKAFLHIFLWKSGICVLYQYLHIFVPTFLSLQSMYNKISVREHKRLHLSNPLNLKTLLMFLNTDIVWWTSSTQLFHAHFCCFQSSSAARISFAHQKKAPVSSLTKLPCYSRALSIQKKSLQYQKLSSTVDGNVFSRLTLHQVMLLNNIWASEQLQILHDPVFLPSPKALPVWSPRDPLKAKRPHKRKSRGFYLKSGISAQFHSLKNWKAFFVFIPKPNENNFWTSTVVAKWNCHLVDSTTEHMVLLSNKSLLISKWITLHWLRSSTCF